MSRSDAYREVIKSVTWLVVGAVASLMAAFTFYYTQDLVGETTDGLGYFILAQTPLFLTFVLTLSFTLTLESYFTKMDSTIDRIIRVLVLLLLLVLFWYSISKVAKSTFFLYSDLYTAASNVTLDKPIQDYTDAEKRIRDDALQNALVRSEYIRDISNNWFLAVISFILICVFRGMITFKQAIAKMPRTFSRW